MIPVGRYTQNGGASASVDACAFHRVGRDQFAELAFFVGQELTVTAVVAIGRRLKALVLASWSITHVQTLLRVLQECRVPV